MLAAIYYPLLVSAFIFLYLLYSYLANVIALRKLGFPIIHAPLIQQNNPIWMISGPLLRPWFKRRLPAFISNKLAFAIYGVEFHQKDITFKEYIEPQVRANPNLLGRGKTYTLATSGRLELWTGDSELAKEIYSRSKDFQQFDISNLVVGIFGQNVITSDGADWSRHRRIVASAITERVSSVVWNESVRQARDLIAAVTKSGNSETSLEASSGTTYQMFDLIKRVALHVLYAAGMGKTQDLTTASGSDTSEKLPSDIRVPYFETIRIVNEATGGPSMLPTALLRNWPSFLPGAAWLHSVGQAKIDFPKHTQYNLAQEREISSSLSEARNNVMSALLKASDRNEGDPEKGDSPRKGPALSESELVGNIYVFTAAGFDTTANSLCYALVFLTRYPQWQTWLIEELDSILPDFTTSNDPPTYNYQSIFPRSIRAQAIMFETLRLFPPLVHLMKMTKTPQTVTIPSANRTIVIPARTTVSVNLIALHRDAAVWRNLNMTPLERQAARDDEDNILTDEHIFRPSRWINPDGTLFRPAPGTYLPWSSGPRVCPGMKMAQVEFVAVLSTLFSRHRLEAVRGTVQHKAGGVTAEVPESDDAMAKRLNAIMEGSQPKLTLEMDVFNVDVDGPGGKGLGLRWIGRR